jgi:hypothetical protein
MTDVDYEPLEIGDRVAFTDPYRGKMQVATIVGFTPKFVKVSYPYESRVSPNKVVKIFDQQGGQK